MVNEKLKDNVHLTLKVDEKNWCLFLVLEKERLCFLKTLN